MSSEAPQNTPEQRQEASHTERLAQRLLEPGVVDVTKVQRRYDRASEPAERSRVIGRLLSRYCPADAQGSHGALLFRTAEKSGASGEIAIAEGSYAARETGPVNEAAAATGRFPGNPPSGPQLQRKEINGVSGGQPAGEKTPEAQAPPPGPLQRLVQRHIAPGLVDVKQAQQQFERIASPVPERLGLVNRLQSRGMDGGPQHVPVSAAAPADPVLRRAIPGLGREFPSPKGPSGGNNFPSTVFPSAGAARSTTENDVGLPGKTEKIQRAAIEPPAQTAGGSSGPDSSAGRRPLKDIFRQVQQEAGEKNPAGTQGATPGPIAKETPQQPQAGVFRVMRKKIPFAAGASIHEKNLENTAADSPKSRVSGKNQGDEGRTIHRKDLQPEPHVASAPSLTQPAGAHVLRRKTAPVTGSGSEGREPAEPAGGHEVLSSDSSGHGPATSDIRAGSEAGLLFRKPALQEGPGVEASGPQGEGTAGNEKASCGAANPVETDTVTAEYRPAEASTTTGAASGTPLLMRSPVNDARPVNTSPAGADQNVRETTSAGSAAAPRENASDGIASAPERTVSNARSVTDSKAPLLMRSSGNTHPENAGPDRAARKAPEASSGRPYPASGKVPSAPEQTGRSGGPAAPVLATPLLMRAPAGVQADAAIQRTVDHRIPASAPGGSGPVSGADQKKPAGETGTKITITRASAVPATPATPLVLQRRKSTEEASVSSPGDSGAVAGTDHVPLSESFRETRTEIPVAGVTAVPATPATPLVLQRRKSSEEASVSSPGDSGVASGTDHAPLSESFRETRTAVPIARVSTVTVMPATPLVLQRRKGSEESASAPGDSGVASGTDHAPLSESFRKARTEIPVASVTAVPVTPATPLVLQRRTEEAAGNGPEPAAKQGNLPATAVELGQEKTAQKPAIIWRKNDREVPGARGFSRDSSAGFSKAGDGVVSRTAAPATTESATGNPQGAMMPAAGTEAQAPALDLDLLAEQVSRLLYRRIETERERRGVGL